ncbi:helix-turn-helix domain-containing protein [Embleya sp. NPDC050493]|uniref:helix-turn-helix domain-containing protein n=1 Tax=Embleya sp. NPDC050493 TaxID=3363989 RepID=UPI00378F804B
MATAPTYARRRLGGELRRLRLRAGLTGESLAEACGWSQTKIVRIETGRVSLTRHDLLKLCGIFGTSEEETARLTAWREGSTDFRWWLEYANVVSAQLQEYLSLEAQAAEIQSANTSVIPGLIQSPRYIEALFATSPWTPDPDLAASLIEVRRKRQLLLEGTAVVSIVIGESLVHATLGSADVLRDQLRHLLELASRPETSIRLLPFDAPASPVEGGVTLLDFAHDYEPSVAVTEHMRGLEIKDGAVEVRRCQRLLGHLQRHTLSPEDTKKVIEQRLRDLV